eukprot:scaffold221232_cov31-Tisochrysis_lutea.AAC.2
MKAKWRDGEYRARLTTNGSHTEERRQKIAEAIRRKWQDPEYRNKTVKGIRKVGHVPRLLALAASPPFTIPTVLSCECGCG